MSIRGTLLKKVFLLGITVFLYLPLSRSQHTFSIVAVDTVSGEIGSAGASCIEDADIISDIVQGRGAIHTQALHNSTNQQNARDKMLDGWNPQQIIDWLIDNDAQGIPSYRQYGIVDLDTATQSTSRSAAHTGSNSDDWKGHITGADYSIQGNILKGPEILDSMEVRYLKTDGELACKLMAALQGANVVGADTRCQSEGTSSKSAFLRVSQPGDPDGNPSLDLKVGNTGTGVEPIDSLQKLFDEARPDTVETAACDSFTVPSGDETYYQSGIYTDTTTGDYSCHNIITYDLTIHNSQDTSFSKEACDEYVFNADTLTASGTYKDTLKTQAGCDSTITLDLTILSSKDTSKTESACEEYVFHGDTLTASGTYTDTLTAQDNCDSIVTLDLTIYPKEDTTKSLTACEQYVFNGDTLSSSGTYLDTLTNVNGCDSIVTLELTINKGNNVSDTVSACDHYVFGGDTLTASGDYKDTLTNAAGCDSIVNLNLTLYPTHDTARSDTACNEFIFHGDTLTQSGIYHDTLKSQYQCDSIVTLDLTISGFEMTKTDSACESYVFGGDTLTSGGIYHDTLTDQNGCDSIITLELAILRSKTSKTEFACDFYVFHGDTLTSSGTYRDTLTNQYQCDSIVTLDLTIDQVDTGVTQSAATLTANAMNASYQWLDCDNGFTPIMGATDRSFSPSSNGNYAVEITDGNCTDTSNCHQVTSIGIREENETAKEVRLYPNPAADRLHLEWTGRSGEELTLSILDLNGRVVQKFHVADLSEGKSRELSIEKLNPGIYQVQVMSTKGIANIRLVIQ